LEGVAVKPVGDKDMRFRNATGFLETGNVFVRGQAS
jgi:hypothetical protein